MLDVTCAPPQRHGPLTVFPLIATRSPSLPFVLMVDALMAGSVKIAELGSGSVPELVATNSGEAGVLVLDGEQLIGAKQNRTTNRSLILPAKSETRIPVSCMEQGRWHHTGDDFKPTKQSSPSNVRRRAREVEADHAMRTGAAPVSALAEAQGAVWSSIAKQSASVGASSATGALDAVYEARDTDIESWIADFSTNPRQIGLLAFIGERPLGMDVIGCTDLYHAVHGRLIRGYVMDALGVRTASGGQPGEEQAHVYLRRVNTARRIASPTVGAGEYAVLSGGVIGGELSVAEVLVHLSAFPVIERPGSTTRESYTGAPISPPSRRRRGIE
jgi:hypothetical protein